LTGKKPDSVIAIDIGCTRTHIGIVDSAQYKCLFRHDFLSTDIVRSLLEVLDEIKDIVHEFHLIPVIISGGVGTRAMEVEKALLSRGATSITHIKHHKGLAVSILYDKPSSLGADRIADALYATAVYPGKNVIVVDSGTAITVDMVNSKGEFIGGAILAGVEAQLKILHSSTGTLPLITTPANKIQLPGTSTESCMQAGTAYGIAGAINLLVRNYQQAVDGECIVLATGGAWHVSESLVDFDFTAIPDLTLIGTALFQ
jgi:type III pantothenate kinase